MKFKKILKDEWPLFIIIGAMVIFGLYTHFNPQLPDNPDIITIPENEIELYLHNKLTREQWNDITRKLMRNKSELESWFESMEKYEKMKGHENLDRTWREKCVLYKKIHQRTTDTLMDSLLITPEKLIDSGFEEEFVNDLFEKNN